MGFDRSKLKASTAEAIKKADSGLATKRPSGGFEKNYLSIDTGENKFRIFPYHPDKGGEYFAEAKCVTFLDVKVPKRDSDGKVVEGQTEVKRKPIFNSKVHGNLKFDLVDSYIDFAKKTAIPELAGTDQDLYKKIWAKIIGDKNMSKSNDTVLKPQTSWTVYASKWDGVKWGSVGLLDLKPSVKDGMTERATELETPDPFSDSEEGIAVIITKAKEAAKPADWYKVKLETKKNGMNVTYVPTPLTDEQLEEWSQMKSLYELYVNVFKRSDLDLQLDGLQRFDKKLAEDFPGYSVFQYDEFLDTVEQMYLSVPEDNGKEDETEEVAEEKEVEVVKPTKVITKPTVAIKAPVREVKKEVVVHEEEMAVEQSASKEDRLASIRAKMGKK